MTDTVHNKPKVIAVFLRAAHRDLTKYAHRTDAEAIERRENAMVMIEASAEMLEESAQEAPQS